MISWADTSRGAPSRPSATPLKKAKVLTRLTAARRATSLAKPAEELRPGWLPLLRPKDDALRSDALVLARNEGYDDCVRRAAAIEAMPIPPTRPTRSTMARYPPRRRRNVARKRYQTTRRYWLFMVVCSLGPPVATAKVASRHWGLRASTTAALMDRCEPSKAAGAGSHASEMARRARPVR